MTESLPGSPVSVESLPALPQLAELLGGMRVVSLPLHTQFRGVNYREVALFNGPIGWSEFSPFLEYGSEESSHWLAAAIEFGWYDPPTPKRHTISVNATLPAVSPQEVVPVLSRYGNFDTVKVKVAEVGQTLRDDLARLERLREWYPHVKLRVDANGAWSVPDAVRALTIMREFRLEYVEQPCATVPELAELRQQGLGVLIAADESIRKAADPYRVAELEAADVIVVKAQPLGGIHRVLELVKALPLQAVVSSALESSIGLAQGLALAAALPEQPYAAGLGTATLFTADISSEPLLMNEGTIELRRPEPDPVLLDEYRVSADREAWWFERVAACYAVLQGRLTGL